MTNNKWLDMNDENVKNEIISWWNTGRKNQLKRCKTIDDILLEPEVYKLKNQLIKYGNVSLRRLSFAIGVISHVKNNEQHTKLKHGIKSLNENRFKKFINAKNENSNYMEFVRIMDLLKNLNVMDVFKIAYYWNDVERKYLIESYYTKINVTEE